ncbi:hypothetical protein RCL1_004646 [Eukaryota sp. TZLM3-RCL]
MSNLEDLFGISNVEELEEVVSQPVSSSQPMESAPTISFSEDNTVHLETENASLPPGRPYLIPPGFLHGPTHSEDPYYTVRTKTVNGQLVSNASLIVWSNGDYSVKIGNHTILLHPNHIEDNFKSHYVAIKHQNCLQTIAPLDRKVIAQKSEVVPSGKSRSSISTLHHVEEDQNYLDPSRHQVGGVSDVALTEDFLESSDTIQHIEQMR